MSAARSRGSTSRVWLVGWAATLSGLLAACASARPPVEPSCPEPALGVLVDSLLPIDPIAVLDGLRTAVRCDGLYALLWRTDSAVAARAREDFFYGGRVSPRGWYDRDPTPAETEIVQHPERFRSATEGDPSIRPGSYWLDSIVNRRARILGTAELAAIRISDDAVWEDGDGRSHITSLLRTYEAWIGRWPDHPERGRVEERVRALAARREGG